MNTMRKFSLFLAAAASLALAACGGNSASSFATTAGSTGTTTSNAAAVNVTSSAASIPADSSAGATIQALVLDSHNNALPNVSVTFSSSAGALQNETTTTSAAGIATATLVANGAAAGSSITVTATSGQASGHASVGVVTNQQTITLLASSPQLPSNGSKPVIITAVVSNASNQLLPGTVVNFTTTSGAIAPVQTSAGAAATPSVPAGTTDATGAAAAELTPNGNPTNRSITVTASVGSTTATITIAVVGTTLSVTGASSLIMGGTGTYTVALTDSGGTGIGGATVDLASAAGNTLSASTVTTDSTGHASFTLTATKSGTDTLTASALGITATQAVAVSSQSFAFTAPTANAIVPITGAQTVTLVWTNAGAPVSGQVVTFSTTRGTFTGNVVSITATTNSTGTASVTLSSTTAGPAVISASATGVAAQVPITFVATVPATIDVQASPSTVVTLAQSTISAIVRDSAGNLVDGATVLFQLTDNTGGSLSVGSAVTDLQGRAQTVYTAGSTSSAANGVTITASVQGTSVTPATATLTVNGQTVFLSLGTGATISENASKTQFLLPYVIQALDAAGNAVANVNVSLTIHSLLPSTLSPPAAALAGPDYTTPSADAAYAKGHYSVSGQTWVQDVVADCQNEDFYGTGIYEASEDLNGNGVLDPGDVASVSPNPVTTDSTGSAAITITYPEDHANWVQVRLTATATVSGTQTTTSATFWLPMLYTYLTNISASPPGVISPYGYGNSPSCANTN